MRRFWIDICIIGAGITGITCAYELSNLGYSIKVVEKSQICSGTTGNTTGKITSQHDAFYDYLINSFDIDTAKKYLLFLRKNSLILFPIHILILRVVLILYPQINTYNLWIQSVLNLVLIHIFMFPACWLINRYLPVFAGKRKG